MANKVEKKHKDRYETKRLEQSTNAYEICDVIGSIIIYDMNIINMTLLAIVIFRCVRLYAFVASRSLRPAFVHFVQTERTCNKVPVYASLDAHVAIFITSRGHQPHIKDGEQRSLRPVMLIWGRAHGELHGETPYEMKES